MNTINAPIGARRKVKTNPLYQYDYGQKLVLKGVDLPMAYEVLFGQDGTELKPVIGDENGVNIPDEFLLNGENVKAYVFLHTGEDDGETEYEITIPVNPRPKATDEPIEPVDQNIIEQAIAVLNIAVDKTTEYMQTTKGYRDETEILKNKAGASEYNAGVSEENARTYKNEALNYAQRAETAESNTQFYKTSAEASARDAYESAERAEQVANTAGYLDMKINDKGHLIYTRTEAVNVDFKLADGHLLMEGI